MLIFKRRLGKVKNSFVGFCVVVAWVLLTPTTWAEENGVEAQNKAMVVAGFDAWKNGTGSPYEQLADNATWTIEGHSLASRTYNGREDFMANVIRPFNARMSGRLIPTIRTIYTDGDTVIVHFDAAGMAKDNKPYRNTYAWFLTYKGNKIVNATAFYDSIAFNDFWQRVQPAS